MTETITLSFDENDFNLHENENGEIEIDSKLNVIYPEANEPGIPVISRDIVVDGNYDYNSASLSIERREIMSNVRIAPTPMLITTDTPINSIQIETNSYTSDRQYPSSNCRYIATSNWDNLNVLHFLTTPFIYNAIEEKLYFIDSIRLDIKLSKQPKVSGRPSNKISYDILKSFVYNSAKVDELTASLPNMQSIDLEDRIDYVVITNKELAPSFKPLCQWKTEKGLYSKIITIEEIKSNYEGKDIQLKIKNCLYDLYINHGLKYVLLGGDNSIVPSRGCYGAVKTDRGIIKDLTIPTDMYYACFDGTFDWDDDNNGIYGEIADNIDLKQSLFVTRLPIYTSDDVNSYVNKLFDYEKHPTFDNNLLMCGVKFQRIESTMKSDTEMKGENFYKKYIKPYWNGIRQRLYDTGTDFDGDSSYDVSAINLSNKIEDGYSFIDVITHGSQTSWKMETGTDYDISFGKKQRNKSLSIVTTCACHTNAFDFSNIGTIDPCLSESLIRNPNSGVIAFLGCSRQGFDYDGPKLGISLIYEGNFYKNLFSEAIPGMNFGVVLAAAKTECIPNCYKNNSYRWIQFGLNPIGDPEMPIWISEPKQFYNTNISFDKGSVNIDTGEYGCRVCIVDEYDHGEGYFNVFEDIKKASALDLPEESSLCITKPGFIPKQIKLSILQNKTISNNRIFNNDVFLCGSSITSSIRQGQFVIKGGRTTVTADIVVLGPGTKIEKGAKLIVTNKNKQNVN